MSDNEHNLIIAAQAKATLGPLGFRRKGRSRVWLADHGFWLAVVEFKPSGFVKGTYCNVSGHWLWGFWGELTFDFGNQRVGGFAEFSRVTFDEIKMTLKTEQVTTPEAFATHVAEMAREAAEATERLRRKLPTPNDAAAFLLEKVESDQLSDMVAYDAAIAFGLTGDVEEAERLLKGLLLSEASGTPLAHERAEVAGRLLDALNDAPAFAAEVQDLIDRQRDALNLPPYQLQP